MLPYMGSYSLRTDERQFRGFDPTGTLGNIQFPYQQQDGPAAGAEVRLPLYTGGRIENGILTAQSLQTASTFDVAQARLDLLYEVAESYVAVLRAQRECGVASDDLQSRLAHEQEVARLFEHERVPRTDYLAARVATSSARQAQIQARQKLEIAAARYNHTLGRPLSSPVRLDDMEFPRLELDLDTLTQLAWEQRPDLQRMHALYASYNYSSLNAKAATRPQVSASASLQYVENQYQTPQALGTAAIIVDYNVFDGGKASRRSRAEQFRAASVKRAAEELRSQISLDLLTAWKRREEATQRLEVAAEAWGHAAENLRVSEIQYQRGVVLSAVVLDAQSDLTQAVRDYHSAKYDRFLAQVRLRYASGLLGVP